MGRWYSDRQIRAFTWGTVTAGLIVAAAAVALVLMARADTSYATRACAGSPVAGCFEERPGQVVDVGERGPSVVVTDDTPVLLAAPGVPVAVDDVVAVRFVDGRVTGFTHDGEYHDTRGRGRLFVPGLVWVAGVAALMLAWFLPVRAADLGRDGPSLAVGAMLTPAGWLAMAAGDWFLLPYLAGGGLAVVIAWQGAVERWWR